jgi:hypothetical protein
MPKYRYSPSFEGDVTDRLRGRSRGRDTRAMDLCIYTHLVRERHCDVRLVETPFQCNERTQRLCDRGHVTLLPSYR